MRCCTGAVYTLPAGPSGWWAICCTTCHRVLFQGAGTEEEVFASY